jgi:hypothetical protein
LELRRQLRGVHAELVVAGVRAVQGGVEDRVQFDWRAVGAGGAEEAAQCGVQLVPSRARLDARHILEASHGSDRGWACQHCQAVARGEGRHCDAQGANAGEKRKMLFVVEVYIILCERIVASHFIGSLAEYTFICWAFTLKP